MNNRVIEKDSKLISVIVPVYNAEKTLAKCVESILNQTYSHYEIILIDDGSTDSSPDLCKDYTAQNPDKVRYIRQSNGGPAMARNTGINAAQGFFIAFADSDDYMMPDMLSVMLSAAERNSAEMVICSYYLESDGKTTEMPFRLPEGLYVENGGRRQLAYSLLEERPGDIRPYSWIRMIKKSVIKDNHLQFESRLRRSEDFHFWCKVHFCVERVFLLSCTPLYYYIENSTSITHTHVEGYWSDVQFIFRDLLESLPHDEEIESRLNMMLIKRSLIALNNATYCGSLQQANVEIKSILNSELLQGVIKSLSQSDSSSFKSFRNLMAHHCTLLVRIKYLLRYLSKKYVR